MKFTVYHIQKNLNKFPVTEVEADSYSILPGQFVNRIDFVISEQNARDNPIIGRISTLFMVGDVAVEAC